MKINNISNNILLGNLPNSTTKFSISNTAEFFNILSSNLYSNPVLAVIRETVTNAYDAHLSNNITLPIKVTLEKLSSNELNHTYSMTVRDYGKGIDPQDIHEIYCTYGNSDKRTTALTGGFGLGCKSPFAVAESFTVISYFSGSKNTYLMTKKDGIPTYTLLNSEPSEETGLEVQIIFTEYKNINLLEGIFLSLAYYCDINIELNGKILPRLGINKPGIYFVKSYHYHKDKYPNCEDILTKYYPNEVLIRYGNNLYNYSTYTSHEQLFKTIYSGTGLLKEYIERINRSSGIYYPGLQLSILIVAEPNTLDITPSREVLNYTSRTINTIEHFWFNKLEQYIKNTNTNSNKILNKYFNNNLNNILFTNYINNINIKADYYTLDMLAPFILLGTRDRSTNSEFNKYIHSNIGEYPEEIKQLFQEYFKVSLTEQWSSRKCYKILESLHKVSKTENGNTIYHYYYLYEPIYRYFFKKIKDIVGINIALYSSQVATATKVIIKDLSTISEIRNDEAFKITSGIFTQLGVNNFPLEVLSLVPVVIVPVLQKQKLSEYITTHTENNNDFLLAVLVQCNNYNKSKTLENKLKDNGINVINLIEETKETERPIDILRRNIRNNIEELKTQNIIALPLNHKRDKEIFKYYLWGDKFGNCANINYHFRSMAYNSVDKSYVQKVILKGYKIIECNKKEYEEYMKLVNKDFSDVVIDYILNYLKHHPKTANLVKLMFFHIWDGKYSYNVNNCRTSICNIIWNLLQSKYKDRYFLHVKLTPGDYTIIGICGCLYNNSKVDFYNKIYSKISWSKCKMARKFYVGINNNTLNSEFLCQNLSSIDSQLFEILTENKNDLNTKICLTLLDTLFGDIYEHNKDKSNDHAE